MIAAPGSVVVGVGAVSPVSGLSLAESGSTAGEQFAVAVSDTNGLLTSSNPGGATIYSAGTTSITIAGTLAQVNVALANLTDTDGTAGTDTLTLNATDAFGNTAGAKSVAVTVNGLPEVLGPASKVLGVSQVAAIAGVSVSESGNTSGEMVAVVLSDAKGLLSAGIGGGAAVTGGGTTTLRVSGTFGQVNAALSTLTDQAAMAGTDTIALNATDGFGNAAAAGSIAVTVNGLPVLAAPGSVTVGVGKTFGIAGVSLAETGTTAGETFTVTLADSQGVLAATAPQGGSASAAGQSLTISGTLAQVNAALATLTDTDGTVAADTISLNATDTLGNHAAAQSIAVTVANGPVIAAPGSAVLGVGQVSQIGGVSLSESGSSATEAFSVSISDVNGLLSTSNAGGASVYAAGTTNVTIAGTLAQVNVALANLTDTDGTAGPDTLTLNATDGFGNTAGAKTVAVTVNGAPVFSAPFTATAGVGKVAAVGGVSLSESGSTGNETFSVRVADTHGVLSVANSGGASVGGSGTMLTLSGTLGQVDAALASLRVTDGTAGSETISLNATDGFGNVAAQTSIALTVNGVPVIAAPGSATVGLGAATGISGVSLTESGTTGGEGFSITLGDGNGLLSTSNAGGASVSGGGTTSLTLSGSLGQVNTALANLVDTDGTASPDTIVLNATDGFGNVSGSSSIAVTVAAGLVIGAPGSIVIGAGRAAGVGGLTLSENGAVAGETFTESLSDASGKLSASGAGGASVVGGGTTMLSINGTLSQVNAALATVSDTDAVVGSETIAVAATDQFGNMATAVSIAVTVNGVPVVAAPGSATVAQNASTAIGGVSVSESGNTSTSGETFTVVVADGAGVLAANTGASGGGGTVTASNGGKTLTIAGTLAQVDADLSTLADTDGSAAADTITVNATDSFGNVAGSRSIAVTVTPVSGALSIAAPGSATVGAGQARGISGVSLSEMPTTGGETFTVVLSDTNGVLSANTGGSGGGGTITPGNGGKTLTISGSLAQVDADLATLADLDGTTPSDTISIGATDSNGGSAAPVSIAVTVNGSPAFSAPASTVIGVGMTASIAGIGLSESGSTAGEGFAVVVSDGAGLLNIGNTGGAAVYSAGTTSVTIAGTLAQVNVALANLTDTDGTAGADTIRLGATDAFGNVAATATIAVTVNGVPVITAPSTLSLGAGKPGAVPGVSLAESGTTAGETFSVTLSDTNGVLSAGAGGGGSVSGPGTTLTIAGSLAQVNAALGTLSDTDGTAGADTIGLSASDSFGNHAAGQSIEVSVTAGPVITAPGGAVIGVGTVSSIKGIGVSESGSTASEGFAVVVSDSSGLLSTSNTGGAGVYSAGTTSVTIAGTLAQVNVALANLTDTDGTAGSETISLSAVDSNGGSAAPGSIAVTVNGLPVLGAPGTVTVAQGAATAIGGVSLSESGNTANELATVTLSDTYGLLSASGAGGAMVSGASSTRLVISGTFAQVGAALSSLTDTDGTAGADTITLNATDGFGNGASPAMIAVTTQGGLTIAAPGSASVGVGATSPISGVGISESGSTPGEGFAVVLSDGAGLLSTSNTGGAGVYGAGTTSVTIAGTLAQVNVALANLTDTDGTAGPDTITLGATDGLGNRASPATIAVTAQGVLAISAPGSAAVLTGTAAAISGVGISESGSTASEAFAVVLSDAAGLLSTSNTGGAGVYGAGTTNVTIAGTLTQVNVALANLTDTDGTAGPDTITLGATDSFGIKARPATIAVTAHGVPVITAPGSASIGVGTAASIAGIGLSESGSTAGEGFAVVLSDGAGLLSTSNTGGASVYSAGTTSVTIAGTLAQVNVALANLTDTDGTAGPDTITIAAGDSFGVNAAQQSIAVTAMSGAPVVGGAGNTAFWTQGNAATAVDPALTVVDQGASSLSGATVSIGAGFLAGDQLGFVNVNGIVGTYDASSGVLTLANAASVAAYQAALDSVTFSSTSADPTQAGADSQRTVTWQAANGSSVSTPVSSTVDVGGLFSLTSGADTIRAGVGNDVFLAGAGTINAGDQISGGGGANLLKVTGGGTFNLGLPGQLAGIQTIELQEGQPSGQSGGKFFANTSQVVTLRDGLNATVNVDPAVLTPGNTKPAGITIIGAHNADVINLGGGNDGVTVGDTAETVNGGSGVDTISVTAQTIGATVNGGSGSTQLVVGGGGLVTMGSSIANISTVTLASSASAFDFILNGQAGLMVTDNSQGADTIQAGGTGQTLTGGAAGQLTFIGATSTTFKDSAAAFNNDLIQGFNPTDVIDIGGLGFTAGGTSVVYTANQGNNGGVLAVSAGGAVQTSIRLAGTFNPSNFTPSGGSTDTFVTYHS